MTNDDPHPTAAEVIAHLNRRFAERGLTVRIEAINVLPYVNPMWMANWDVSELPESLDREAVEEEVREARWIFPQVLEG